MISQCMADPVLDIHPSDLGYGPGRRATPSRRPAVRLLSLVGRVRHSFSMLRMLIYRRRRPFTLGTPFVPNGKRSGLVDKKARALL